MASLPVKTVSRTVAAFKNRLHQVVAPIIRKVAPNAKMRPHGMLPEAFAAYLATGYKMQRVGQTMTVPGHVVAASAGTHDQDGVLGGIPYAVCVDFRVKDMTEMQVKTFLMSLWSSGFAAWYRCAKHPEDHWLGVTHVHAAWAAAPMKAPCRKQVHSFCHKPTLTGLKSDLEYHFAQPSDMQRQKIAIAFLAHNPAEG